MAGGCHDCGSCNLCHNSNVDKNGLKYVTDSGRSLTIALAGNPNCGKTTAYNFLTASNAGTGNRPGVTVDVKAKFVRSNLLKKASKAMSLENIPEDVIIVDIPGIYSLESYTEEERIASKYLLQQKPDVIINIIDATNLERGLFLNHQLKKTGIPVLVALNMMDEAMKLGFRIDETKLAELLGVPVVKTIAYNGKGLDELLLQAIRMNSSDARVSLAPIRSAFIRKATPKESPEQIYKIVSNIIENSMIKGRKRELGDLLDKILLNTYFGLPIFALLMGLIFWVTFGTPGNYIAGSFELALNKVFSQLQSLISMLHFSEFIERLIVDGIIGGVAGVFVFIPQILLMFLFIAVLEDSGYMARAAFLTDSLMRRFGLGGRSFIPMVVGFGCTVPAILSTRTIPNKFDRIVTSVALPFISCGARLPVYGLLAAAFFGKKAYLVITVLYFFGIFAALFTALIFKRFVIRGESAPLIMELPPYRIPGLRNIGIKLWETGKEFVTRLGTVILIASIIVWMAQSMTFSLSLTVNPEDSISAAIGKALAPLFVPLGFGDWQRVSTLIAGIAAKETIVSALNIIYGSTENALQTFTKASSLSFMFFVLLYIPCAATMITIAKEVRKKGTVLLSFAWQMIVAWMASFLVYRLAILIGM